MVVLEKYDTIMEYKMITTRIKTIFASILAFAILPLVNAYASGPGVGMMNFWDILVENLFGSFWPAVLFLAIIFFIILMLGGISFYTVIIFEAYFFLAMAIGYGYSIFVFPVLVFSFIYLIWQVFKLIFENR
jgi:hypothetical protein